MQKLGRSQCRKAVSYTWLMKLFTSSALSASKTVCSYIQLACWWWIYFLHKSMRALIISTSTGVIALRNHPWTLLKGRTLLAVPCTQPLKTVEKRKQMPYSAPPLCLLNSSFLRGYSPVAQGRVPSSQRALQAPWTDPCHCVLFGQEWRTPAIWSRAMLWYKEPLLNRVHGSA